MSRLALVLMGWLWATLAMGQVVVVDSLPEAGFPLTATWTSRAGKAGPISWAFRAGDDPEWSRPNLNDSDWQRIQPTRPVGDLLPLMPDDKTGWLRLRLRVKPELTQQGLILAWRQTAATELFVNGKRLRQTGTFPTDGKPAEPTHSITQHSVLVQPDPAGNLVLAVRFAVIDDAYWGSYRPPGRSLFWARLLDGSQPVVEPFAIRWQRIIASFTAGLFFMLALLHGLFFVYNTNDRANGAMALACAAFTVAFSSIMLVLGVVDLYDTYAHWSLLGTLAYPVGYIALMTAMYTIYEKPFGIVYFLLVASMLASGLMVFILPDTGANWTEFVPALLATAECGRVTLLGRRQWGGEFISAGMLSALVLFSVFSIYSFDELASLRLISLSDFAQQLIYYLAVLFIPLSISLYIARSFVFTQRRMAGQLLEVQRLSKQSFEQEKDRQTILARQKETLEKQVVERTAQLQESLDELRSTQNQLVQKEKMASLGELTAGIAHEIQNPLNFVNNFSEVSVDLVTELLEERQRPPAERDADLEEELLSDLSQNLTKISHHGQRASGIVRNMLQHSRTSTGQREPTDLNALADEYLRLSYHGLRAKDKSFNANFRTELDADLPRVKVVAQDIGRVLLNLFNNAFYAVQQRHQQGEANYQPTVTVETKVVGKRVEIRVRDNGVGIPEDVRSKIFQPFFTTKPTGSGTGLGLSLSYDIVTKGHGGTLDVESEAGQFTEFRITLPIQVA
ncbi:sensor histidine kinase [uncultured Fibrella sp.]|uniref:sensor histidine kinase n=1 Tax=uncultured Fibrella sp. TaxID=1284596 RepID=UPI0035CB40C3